MIILGRIKEITDNWVKMLIYGSVDVRTSVQVLPHGVSSKPIMNKIGLYLQTDNKTKSVFLGTVHIPEKVEIGEIRLYATDANGVEKSFTKMHNADVASVSAGEDWAVKYSGLKSAFEQLQSDHDNLVQAFNTHMHATAATGPPSIPTISPPYIPAVVSSADITIAKNKRITTND